MNVAESKRSRHLVIHIEHGEELPAALIRALDEVEAKAGIIHGTGIVDAVEVANIDAQGHSRSRRINAPALVSCSGNVAIDAGTTNVHLFATLMREAALGQETFAGQVLWARARSLDLFVTVFDDVSLTRETDGNGWSTALRAQARASSAAPRVTVQEAPRAAAPQAPAPQQVAPTPPPEPAPESAPIASAPLITPPPAQPPARPITKEPEIALMQPSAAALAPPARLQKPQDEGAETYPEVGDIATHFHFGECEVISSDGERIRLRQIKDGRVREVALTMLKIEGPKLDAAGKRCFKLSRKN